MRRISDGSSRRNADPCIKKRQRGAVQGGQRRTPELAEGCALCPPNGRGGHGASRLCPPYSNTVPQRRAERPVKGENHRAGGERDARDHQEEVRLRHAGPEAAEIARQKVADEARG